ncbi:MAG: RluA family pseudouridine synthase [Thermoanaerobacterales bacterium]|nr:RluA family pseudouridine synthase [Thermoanaerobacterales bacterium]
MTVLSRLEADEEDSGLRLDVFLANEHSDLTRSRIQHLIRENRATVNGVPARQAYRLRAGDIVALEIPEPEAPSIRPEPIPLDIYYEDGDVIVVNKPRGMVVHPAVGNYRGTLVNALLYHCRDLSGINGVLRPGIVHRLDKDTSGLLMVAKNDGAHLALAAQLKARAVTREYIGLAHGRLTVEEGTIAAPIGRHPRDRQRMAVVPRNGRPAVTHYRVMGRYGAYTLLRLRLETGRTHQIRVHLAHIGHPLVADLKYGHARAELGLSGQFLHAGRLGFIHPSSGNYLEFEAPLPGELQSVLDRLGAQRK